MAKVSNREDALFNAYLSKYKNAQASTVSEGQSKTQAARQKGAAILNATDKTLPSLGDTYGSTLQNIVSGAKMENSLSSDVLNRSLSLAKAQYDYASDMHTQMTAAKKYADEQAEKARKEAEEAAAKAQQEAEKQAAAAAKAAAKASRSSGRRSTRSSSSKKTGSSTASSEDAAAALAALDAEETTAGTTTKKNTAKTSAAAAATSTAKNETAKQSSKEKRQAWQKAQREQHEEILNKQKQQREKVKNLLTPSASAGAGKSTGKSYAEQQNAGNTTQKPTASQAVTRTGQPVASSYAAAGQDSSPEVKTAVKKNRTDYKSVQEDTATALKKLQTDASYRAELAAPGRKLTTAEIKAVNQYSDPLWSVKQYAKGGMSADELNQEARERSSLQSKAQFNGLGQSAQAFTAGLYGAFPFATKASDKLAETANSIYPDKEIPVLSKTLDETKSYDPLAAFAGNMAGQRMKYKLFNTAVEGTKYADAAQKAGGKLYNAAKNIPVLKDIVQPGFGEAAGRVLADTGADLALDTLPTLADDLSTYSAQQQAIANGETVDDAMTPGGIAADITKNVAGNVAMNALPEIGGAVISGIKNRRAADKMLEQQAKELDEWKAMTSGLYNADDYAAPDDAIDFTAAIQNSLDDTARQQRDAAAATRAEQLNSALAEQAAEDSAAYTARQAAQNSGNLPIDAQGAAAYNGTNGGVGNEQLGGRVQSGIQNGADSVLGNEYEPGYLYGGADAEVGARGESAAAQSIGRTAAADPQGRVPSVEEWAKGITGKDNRSPYTRRIIALQEQLQNGASRESLMDEAKSIAQGIVKPEDYAIPVDDSTTILKDYLKNTQIKIDDQTKGELLSASGLKSIQQYNIQNGTNFSTKKGLDYDVAVIELYDQMGMGNRAPDGNAADALINLVQQSKAIPLVDTDMVGTMGDYTRDWILDGATNAEYGADFTDWLERQGFDKDMPEYTRNVYDRMMNDELPRPTDYDLLSLEDNYQQFEPAPQYDDSELSGLFLNENAPMTSDAGYSYAADHLQDAMNQNSSGSVAPDSPYYNDWMLNQGALRQQQVAGGLLTDDADAMEAAANRMDSLNRRSEELLGQDAVYRQQQGKAAARQARLDAIQQEYEQAANQVPTLEPLAGSTADWQTQPGLTLENGEGLDAYTAPAARQTAESVQTAAPQARPLNGSESVPENAVGATNARYSTDKVVENKDYANQAAVRVGLDDAHREGLTYSEHQVWTDTEAQHQALDDINTYIQEAGGDVDKGLDNAMNALRKDTQWDKGESVTANNIRDRLRTEYMKTEPGTPEFYRQKARYDDWQSEISKQRSKVAQTMQSFTGDATARMHEASNPIREKWETQHSVEVSRIKELTGELDKLKAEIAQRNLDDMNSQDFTKGVISGAERDKFQVQDSVKFPEGIREGAQKAGDMDAEFGQMLKEMDGVTDAAKTDTTAEFDALTKRVKELCEKRKVNCSDDAAKEIAGRILNGDSAEQYYNKLIMQAAGISDLTLDEMERVDTLYSKAATMGDSKERYALEQDAINIMAKHLPAKSWFERFDNIRYLAMLGNPTTHARNLIGNVLMKGLSDTKDEVAAAMQLVTTKKADRTKALYVPQDMKDAASKWIDENHYAEVVKDGGKYNLDSGLERARSTYGQSIAGRALQTATDFNSNLLDKEDEIFVRMGATHSLANILTARGYDASIFTKTDEVSQKALLDALELAKQDAKDVTFHADTALTKAMNRISKAGDKNGTLGDKISYCIGNGILPFAKTPANILKTAAEYNPVGATVEAVYRGATHKGSAAVTDALAKGVVGSGIMGVGYWLAHEGFLTGTLDEDTKNYDEMLGKQEYSVNIPGVGSYSLDWAAPAIVPLMMGANMEQSGYDLDTLMANPDNFAKVFGQVSDIFVKALDPVTDMSMMQSLNNTLDNIRYNDESIGGSIGGLALDAGTAYLKQYVPTVLSKAARSIDDTRRSSYGGGSSATERNTNYLLRSTMNKVPVLSKNNEPYIDQWGRTEQNLDGTDDTAGGMFLRGVYNFASPGYYSAENVTPVDEYLQGLYGDTNNSKVYPEKASSKITVDGEGYYMTPEEKTAYAKTSGHTAYDIVDSLRQNDMFLQLPEDQQAELVQNAYSVAKTIGGVAAVGDGVSGTKEKEYEAYQNGGTEGVVNYMLAKNAVDVALDDVKASTGDADASLGDVEKWNAIHSELGDNGIDQFVSMTKKDSLVRRVDGAAGSDAAAAYMNAYSAAVAKAGTDEDGKAKTPSKYDVGVSMMKQGLSAEGMAKAYVAAYGKEDKKGASIYQNYGASGVQGWVRYKAAADLDGNGSISKDEAVATLNQMDLTNELRRAYITATNKKWSNPY